jgi:gas vesicle protein
MTATATHAAATDDRLAAATRLVGLGLRACEAYGRDDLSHRLSAARRGLADPAIHVVVVGEFKQGKSSLVNALVGADICPVADDIATAVPTYVRHGPDPSATLIFPGDPPRRQSVPLDEVRQWVTEDRPAESSDEEAPAPAGVEVRLPRQLLAGGLVLVDTPGVGGLGSAHAAASLAAASMADALLFVSDASQELTFHELAFLRRARDMCATVLCVLTKTDFYPAWRKVKDLNERHLAGGPPTPLIPVSSMLRRRAVAGNDQKLNQESGFPDLVQRLVAQVRGGAAGKIAAEAAAAVAGVCEQLETQFASERSALVDSAAAKRVVDELTAVKQRVETLKSAAARWSQTLTDGIADLNSDVDHDLRRRIREIITEAEEAIDKVDPADTWSQMESWLESRVAGEMLANYTLLRDRATTLSEEVGEHFQEASGEVLRQFPVTNPAPLATSVSVDHQIDLEKMKVGKQAMVALKAAYGGAIMFVMIGVMTGFTLGPLALGIGVVMGRKGLKEEKQRQTKQRQAQAKNAVRRYCDQVSFVVGKDSKDTLRRIQRELRDHYTALAEEINRSNAEALRAATEATNRTQAERDRRLSDIDAELTRLRTLRQQAEGMAT